MALTNNTTAQAKQFIVGDAASITGKRTVVDRLPDYARLYRSLEVSKTLGLLNTPFTIIATPAWAAKGNGRVWTAQAIVNALDKPIYFEDEGALADYKKTVLDHKDEILTAIEAKGKQPGDFPLLEAIFSAPQEFAGQQPKQ